MNAENNKGDKDANPMVEVNPEPDVPPEDLSEAATPEEKLRQELLYMRADFENAKRRLLRDQEQAVRFANEKIIGELVGVADLSDRALQASRELKKKDPEVAGFVTGVEMTHRELVKFSGRFRVELTGAVGEVFDPNRMEAISQSPVDADCVDKVIAVAQRGCLLQGRLIKPAKVVVGISKAS